MYVYIARSLATLPIYAVEYNVRFYRAICRDFGTRRSDLAGYIRAAGNHRYADYLREMAARGQKGDERVFDAVKKKDDSLVRAAKKILLKKSERRRSGKYCEVRN